MLQNLLSRVMDIKESRLWSKASQPKLQTLESFVVTLMWIAGFSELARLL